MDLCTKHIDALTTGDLGIQFIFIGNLPNRHQLRWRDFTTCNTRHDRVRTIFLHVGQIVVIGVLQLSLVTFEYKLVVDRSHDGADCGFADIATTAMTMLLDQFIKSLNATYL